MEPKPLTETLTYTLAQTCKATRTHASKFLAQLGLHPGQEFILAQLWQEDGLTHSQLAERLAVQPPTISKMLQRMEAAGLVRRCPCPHDSRVSHVSLTEHGREIQHHMECVWAQLDACFLNGLSLEERVLLRRLLMQVRANVEAADVP
jgi:DNA-binding MarR family transcriptional regulator